MMEKDKNVLEDECAEVSVNTEEVEPRGRFAEKERQQMTSFETLVHTALALEDDPRAEHSYAYSDKKMSQESANKDHCYYSGSKLGSHRKVQSISDENLHVSAQRDVFEDSYFVLPHYRSNDSALDVTGFDTISDKCLSFENIHVKTVDVFTENCILPGVSDPDLSRMTIQPQLPSFPSRSPLSGGSVNDHSYSSSSDVLSEHNKRTLLKDHTYNFLHKPSSEEKNDNMYLLKDHSYGNRKRRDSLPASVGIKRGRSNDDLSLLSCYNFKRKDFTKSPFLDHTYQSVELQKVQTKHQSAKRNKTLVTANKLRPILPKDPLKCCDSSQNVFTLISLNETKFPNQLLTDHSHHTYEEIMDSTGDLPPTEFLPKTLTARMGFAEIKTDNSDHSYVIPKQYNDSCDDSSSDLSDSGTESLNDDEDMNIPVPVSLVKHEKRHTEHPYFKSSWRPQKKS